MIAGVGIDLVEIARVEKLLDGKGERAIARLFTEAEVTYARTRARPAMHLAARLAAKEAAFKALTGSDEARLIGWREVEVVSPPGGGAPALRFHGRAAVRAKELRVVRSHLSITHTDTTAGAVVVLDAEG
jgi:holo-[acyl-carrier protein] synthase